jgi:hypothetical protein
MTSRGLFFGFYRLAAAAVRNATQLLKLDIEELEFLLDLLHETPLIHLRECALPYQLSAGRFLLNHPNVEKFAAHVPDGYFPTGNITSLIDLPQLHLPQLTSFRGVYTLAPHMLQGSVVKHVTLYWDGTERQPEKVLASLASVNNTLAFLDNCVPEWECELMPAIASHLPNLTTLSICNFATRNFNRGLIVIFTSFFVACSHGYMS